MESAVLNYLKFEMTAPTAKFFFEVIATSCIIIKMPRETSFLLLWVLTFVIHDNCSGDLFVLLKQPVRYFFSWAKLLLVLQFYVISSGLAWFKKFFYFSSQWIFGCQLQFYSKKFSINNYD